MEPSDPLGAAIAHLGLSALAKQCGVTHQAVRKWHRKRRMPRTEWTGETQYAEAIERAMAGRVTRDMLLAPWPAPAQPPARAPRKAAAPAKPDSTAQPAAA